MRGVSDYFREKVFYASLWERFSTAGCIYRTKYSEYEDKFRKSDNFQSVESNLLAFSNEGTDWGYIQYRMRKVPDAWPLFAYAKVGFSADAGDTAGVTVKIELIESTILKKPCREVRKNTYDCRGTPYSKTLIEKTVELRNSNKWHDIYSDYPVFKIHEKSHLILRISAKQPVAGRDFFVFHAQVGTDKQSLGLAEPTDIDKIYQ
ncbi:MAG: hypothetical protein HYW48_00235 [Deltaproteobacteria bacterium]|nr:hypothetical protein [Deltaproteobacteria bacterium]